MSTRVGIIGIGQSAFKPRRDDASYPALVREAVNLALRDAKLELDGIEAVVYSLSPDAMVGIGNAERLGVEGGRRPQQALPAHQHRRRDGHLQRRRGLLPCRRRRLRRRDDRGGRQGRRMRRQPDGTEQDLGPDLRARAAARHHHHAGDVGGALHGPVTA